MQMIIMESFLKLQREFLLSGNTDADKINPMAGFSLKNTLSENGAVITEVFAWQTEAGFLKEVVETMGIQCVDGKIQ